MGGREYFPIGQLYFGGGAAEILNLPVTLKDLRYVIPLISKMNRCYK